MDKKATISLRVTEIQDAAQGIKTFHLADPHGADLPEFSAGSHVQIRTPSGEWRKYSLCNDCADRSYYEISVKREANGRGGSLSLCDQTNIGDVLECKAPDNAFALEEKAKSHIFIAGGIGITPFMSMIRSLGELPASPWKLFYMTRDEGSTAYLDELASGIYPGKIKIHHTKGDSSKRLDLWPVFEKENTAHVYCCGSRGLMDDVRDMTGHWNTKFIHFENFDDSIASKPDDQPFVVDCAKSGVRVNVAANQTILQALTTQGIAVSSSCESGTCGSCKCELLSGAVEHRDYVLLPEEHESRIMVCVSRAVGHGITVNL